MDDEGRIGLNLIVLAQGLREWIPRRHETVEYLNHAVARRSTRVDLDLSAIGRKDDLEEWPRWNGSLLVPIALLRRESHVSIEVRDETGSLVPRLNRTEERHLLQAGIEQIARRVLGGEHLDPGVSDDLGAIVFDRVDEPDLSSLERRPQGRDLLANQAFVEVLRRVARSHYLAIPIEPNGHVRRVVTYSLLEDIRKAVTEDEREAHKRERYHPLRALIFAFRFMGTRPIEIDAPSASDAASYHLEVPAPYDLEITWGRVDVIPAQRDAVRRTFTDDDRLETHSHVHVDMNAPIAEAKFRALLRLAPTALVRSAPLVSSFVVLTLIFALLYGVVTKDWLFKETDTNSAVSLLLLVPGAVATVIASPSTHSLTTRLLLPTRLILWATGLCSFTCALSVAIGLRGGFAVAVWSVALLAASACSLALWSQYFRLKFGSVDA